MSSNVRLDSLLALRQVVCALELRFPDPNGPFEYGTRLAEETGELATAINHAEGVGVKKEKHGDESSQHVYEKSYALAHVIAWMVAYFDVGSELETQIAEAYLDYKEKEFIK